MRIVYICDFFHPDAGYHPNLLSKYWVRFGHEVVMLTSELERMPVSLTHFFDCENIQDKDRAFEEMYGVKIIRCPIYKFVSGRSVYKMGIFRKIRALNPDVVYVNGNDSLIGMQLTATYAKHSFGLVMDSHMLDMASNNRFKKLYRAFYRKTFARQIIKYKISVIRAQNDDYVQRFLGVPLEQCPWISFGSDMLLFHPDEERKKKWRESHGLGESDFVLLYAGKVNKTKGLDLFAKAVRDKFCGERNVCVVIVGATEGKEGKELEEAFQKIENRVVRFPTQKYTDLPEFYQMADLVVFPKQCSLSFFDAQACGVPVVFEDNNINVDRSSAHNAIVFASGSAEKLRDAIETFLHMEGSEFTVYRKNAVSYVKKHYNYEEKAREYLPYLQAAARRKGRL